MFSAISPWPTGIKHGIIWGIISIIFSLALYIFGADLNSWVRYTVLIFVVGVFITSINAHKKNDLGGYINFGRAYAVGMIAILALAMVGILYLIVYLTFLQPDFVEIVLEKTKEAMEDRGSSEETIEKSVAMTKKFMSTPFMIMWSFVSYVLYGAIFGLIVAGIIGGTSKPPENYQVPAEIE